MKHVNVDPNPERQKQSDEVMDKLTQNTNATLAKSVDIDDETLVTNVVEALKEIYDPEIPVNIYDLGLIYRVDIKDGVADVDMTLTTPGCPVAQTFPGMVETSIKKVEGIADATVNLIWDPPWTQDQLSEAARLQLGLM